MDHNPFYDVVKADAHSPQDIAGLFVKDASPIWDDLQSPINHIVVGARGTGKTMALRQLDYRTLAINNEISGFVGVYIHVSRVSAIFHSLLANNENASDDAILQQYQQVFADYLVLEISRNLCDMVDVHDELEKPEFRSVFRTPGGFDTGDIVDDCARLQLHIESSIQSWRISNRCSWQPLGDLPTIIARLAHSLQRANSWLERDKPCLYILLDESSPVPIACQSVINNLLLRGQPFCVKLAIRPFEWSTLLTPSSRAREQNTDVFVLHLEQSDELAPEYVSRMEQIVNKILISRNFGACRIREILPNSEEYPYSGFEALCAASSGNPQDLLLICSAIFAARKNAEDSVDSKFKTVSASLQSDVVQRWSSDFVKQNTYEASRHFCQSLVQEVKKTPESIRSIGFEYQSDEADVFTNKRLPDDLANVLRPAFAGGFVQRGMDSHESLFDMPISFKLSRSTLPDLAIPLETPSIPAMTLDREFVEVKSRTGHHYSPTVKVAKPVAYLTSSFLDPSDSRWEPIRQALLVSGFSFPKSRQTHESTERFQDIRRDISKSRVALVGTHSTMSRAMFEIGLCAGATRPVDVIVGLLDNDAFPLGETEVLPRLPTVSLQPNDSNFVQFTAEVRAVADQIVSEQSEFANVGLTGVSLRPKRRREKTVYISLPSSVIELIPIDVIREGLSDFGWSLITESDMTSYSANAFQVPILCAYTARVGVIDTSIRNDATDLMQTYKLGLFAGKRGWRVLHTSNTNAVESSPLDGIKGAEYFQWQDHRELIESILRFVRN